MAYRNGDANPYWSSIVTKRYYTVVFEITDEESWKHYGPQFSQSLADEEPVRTGVRVVSCGNGDCMTACDAYSDTLVDLGYEPDEVIREWCAENDISPEEAKLIIG